MTWHRKYDGDYSVLYESSGGESGYFEFSKDGSVLSMHEVFNELVYLSERCKELSATIAELLNELNKNKQRKWISADEDIVPTPRKKVLAITKELEPIVIGWFGNGGTSEFFYVDNVVGNYTATHWMELPETPKETENE